MLGTCKGEQCYWDEGARKVVWDLAGKGVL